MSTKPMPGPTSKPMQIDLLKLMQYVLKRIWLVIICAVIGFAGMYGYVNFKLVDTYVASGTMYIYNGNPNLINYQYVSSGDLNSAVMLLDTYMVVVKSNKVMDSVADRLAQTHPGITAAQIRGSLSMGSVSETGVLRVNSTTTDPQLSMDICNAVMDVAPSEIIRVVGGGSAQVIDYATLPLAPVSRGALQKGITGGLAGAVAAAGLLTLLYLYSTRKVDDTKTLESNYTPPVLASVTRSRREEEKPSAFLLNKNSSLDKTENYAKLRMNLLYTLVDKRNNVVAVTSAISGEGKSTITANLAISLALGGKSVLLIDADLRRGCQREIFEYDEKAPGVSQVLVGTEEFLDCVLSTKWNALSILPAGHLPPNPAELLSSPHMKALIKKAAENYDIVLIDVPPINIVSDPLVLSDQIAGCLFVARQGYSTHKDIRRALMAAQMTNMDVLGFVFYGEKLHEERYYTRKYYNKYYHKPDAGKK